MFDAFLGKFSKEQRKDLSEMHGVLWEEDEAVINCRDCASPFTVSLRKHHCRGCGGIYCEDCSSPYVVLHPGEEPMRACISCQRGETPGEDIVKISQKVLQKKGADTEVFQPSTPILLHSGSLYGDDESRSVRLDKSPAHRHGYFEVINKSNEMMAVKLLQSGGDPIRELCRPAYIAGNLLM